VKPTRRTWLTLILPICGVIAVGCAVHEPGFDEPLEIPAAFLDEGEVGAGTVAAPDRWWMTFDDATLNALQTEALGGNFDLAVFRDRLDAARSIVTRDRSVLFPRVDYDLFAQQTRRKSNDFAGEDQFGAGIVGTYEVDLWKRNANFAESAELNEQIAQERLKAAAIALSANVALTWYALVEQRGQAAILKEQILTNEKVLHVVRVRFGGGAVRASDVLRQERLLESTREQRAVVRAQIEVLEHALLVLTGRSPTERLDAPRNMLPSAPPRPALGLPSELVQRRPDVRSAFMGIQDADARIAIAVADRYPSVQLRIDAVTVETSIADLFDDWFSVIGVDVIGPLFDADRRSAEVDRTAAVKRERINVYAQTILLSFRQVLDAISRERAREEQIARIERQLDLAARTSERLNREYLNGDISYIDVLEALTTEQQLQRDLLSTRFQRISDRITLYEALAGGWDGIVPDEYAVRDTSDRDADRAAP